MDCDGTKAGYDLELTRAIADTVSIPVIASGGAGTLEDFCDALTEGERGRGAGGLPVPLQGAGDPGSERIPERTKACPCACREGERRWRPSATTGLPVLKEEFGKPYYRQLFQTVNQEYRDSPGLSSCGGYFQCLPPDSFSSGEGGDPGTGSLSQLRAGPRAVLFREAGGGDPALPGEYLPGASRRPGLLRSRTTGVLTNGPGQGVHAVSTRC